MKRSSFRHSLIDPVLTKIQLFHWAKSFDRICYLNSNGQPDSYELIMAVGVLDELVCETGRAFDQLNDFYSEKNDWIFGFCSYDLKNELENLQSGNTDELGFPALHFFQPEY